MASAEPGNASDGPAMLPIWLEAEPEELTQWAERIFKALPHPAIPRLPSNEVTDLTNWRHKPRRTPAEALQKCADALEKYDAEECKAYREEIDTLLVFAGLFSAVVTAFSIESYQWLQSDPNDTIIALLSLIAHPTNQTETLPTPKGLSDDVSTRINAYWFLSLALSLSAALVAIVCKQWVREFERHSGLSDAAQFIGVRQMKLEGFEAWRAATVVAAIPLLLQCALGLFALGLLELLWNLHVTVALVVLIPTTAALVFYTTTTLLPGVQAISSPFRILRGLPQCPFKSSQAMLALRLLVLLRIIILWCCGITKIVWEFSSTHLFRFWHPESPRDSETWWQDSHRPSDRSSDSVHRFPVFQQMESWLRMDQMFASIRDEAYTQAEYHIVLYNEPWRKIPPGFFFSALSWLRDHVHQPDIESWISLSIWARIPAPRSSFNLFTRESTWRLQYGILAALPQHLEVSRTWNPASLALRYLQDVHLEHSFVSEALIHHLPNLDLDLATQTCTWLLCKARTDGDTTFSILHAIIAVALNLETGGRSRRGTRRLLCKAYPLLLNHPRAVLHPMLACVVAVYLRELLVGGCYDTRDDLHQLWAVSMKHLGPEQEPNILTPSPSGEKAVYAALALAIDQGFENSEPGDVKEHMLAHELVQPGNREVYLELLSTALGSSASAQARFEQNVEQLERENQLLFNLLAADLSPPPSPTPPARHSPEPAQVTGLNLTEHDGEPSSGTGAGNASSPVQAPVQEAPSRQDTDNPGSNSGSA